MVLDADLKSSPARLTLDEPDDFTSLKVRVHGARAETDALTDALEPVGTLDEGGNALLAIAQLRRLAGDRARDEQWRASFDAMVEYARAKGWVTGDGARLQAHCEWQ